MSETEANILLARDYAGRHEHTHAEPGKAANPTPSRQARHLAA
jgi:hypothetical protein